MELGTSTISNNIKSANNQAISNSQTAATYPFVDWIRMIAMVGIIWAHTPNFEGAANYKSLDNIPLYFFFMNFFKFGVICFFLISGFLLSSKIENIPVFAYYKKRVLSTLYPYLFAFALIVLLFVFKTHVLHQASSYTVFGYIKSMFFDSALWFLPNYWISLLVIVCCKRLLSKAVFGFILLLITLAYTYFYVYTIYAQPHVNALFGFVFYLWLGYFIGKKRIHLDIQRLNIYMLLAGSVCLYIISSTESVFLNQQGSDEPMNILKISNQLYSVLAFITMVRLFNKTPQSTLINPRKETFGIYLYHMFALAVLAFGIKFLSGRGIDTFSNHSLSFIAWFLIKFIFVYLFTLLIVKFMLRYRLGFLNYKSS